MRAKDDGHFDDWARSRHEGDFPMPLERMNPEEMLLPTFTPEDIRQYDYCPRIIYHRYVLRLRRNRTYKMKLGTEHHEEWREKQIQRGTDCDRYFEIYLANPNVGLIGLLDAIDYDGKHATPIELKTGRPPIEGIYSHHKIQVLAQCFLVESCLKAEVSGGIVYYEASGQEISTPYSENERILIAETLKQMREIVSLEVVPERPPKPTKCIDCEFAPFCV